jgi:hypothetical protein
MVAEKARYSPPNRDTPLGYRAWLADLRKHASIDRAYVERMFGFPLCAIGGTRDAR